MAVVGAALWASRPAASGALLADGELLALWVAWTAALAVAAWHGVGAVLCAAATVAPNMVTLGRISRCSPRLVRRVAGVTCTASVVLTPGAATAATVEPSLARPPASADEPFVRAPQDPTEVAPVDPVTPPPAPMTNTEPSAAPITATRSHVVVQGDNLWRIAAAELSRVTGDANPSDGAIVPYWRRVVDGNRATLRSGDPSLIYPGEIVTLPAP